MAPSPRPAATVILYRPGPPVEVFLVQRSPEQRFFPGYHAFPGGTIDPGEDFARCAVREVAEETGLVLDPDALTPAGRLVTPEFAPRRYDTQFYVAPCPVGETPRVVPGELVGGMWWRPEAALDAWHRGEILLPPPTLAYLRVIASSGNVEDAARLIAATDHEPHHRRFRIEMHPRVSVLPLKAPTLPPATTQDCYFIEGARVLYVVDPGTPFPGEQAILREVTQALLDEGREPAGVLLTHHHADHVAAARLLKEEFGFPVFAHAETAKRLEGLVDREVLDGDAFDLGFDDRSGKRWILRALHTPGHSPGHLAFLDERFGALFTGDLVSGVSTILVDPPEGDMGDYFRSLERLSALDITMTLPGHGPAIPGKRILDETLGHRRWREARVKSVLSEGGEWSLETLLPKVYDDAPPEASALALRSLKAHLLKLEKEGGAATQDGRWRALPG